MATLATAATNVVRIVVRAAAQRGVDPASLLAAVGLIPENVERFDVRVPQTVELALWNEAVRRSGDEALALHAAETLAPGAFDVLDWAVRTSPTLGEAYSCVVRYHRLVHDFVRFDLEIRDGVACLHHQTFGDLVKAARSCSDFALATLVVVGRQVTGIDWDPREVAFQHAAPTDVGEYQRLFRSPLRFGAPRDELSLDAEILDRPLVSAEPGLCSVLDRYATELLGRVPAGSDLRERVTWLIGEELRGGELRAATFARKLHMSPRNLQRCLAREGSSFRELSSTLRRSLAERYLEDRRVALTEVAFLLGFSEPSAFHRAFKRWTGMTPADYRRQRAPARWARRGPERERRNEPAA
jgi:AraC-like DNA-binding protein